MTTIKGSLIQEVCHVTTTLGELSSLISRWIESEPAAGRGRRLPAPQLLSREDSQVKKTPVVEGSIHPLGSLSLFRPLRCLVTFFCLHPPRLTITHSIPTYTFYAGPPSILRQHLYFLSILLKVSPQLTGYPTRTFGQRKRIECNPGNFIKDLWRCAHTDPHSFIAISALTHSLTHSLTHPSGSPIKATIWPSSINQSINWSPLLIHPPSQQFPQHTNATC